MKHYPQHFVQIFHKKFFSTGFRYLLLKTGERVNTYFGARKYILAGHTLSNAPSQSWTVLSHYVLVNIILLDLEIKVKTDL
jgi:hypothetical protein